MTYGNQSCFEKSLDKFDSAVAFLLQKNNGRNTSNMYDLDDWFSLFVSWFGYKGENTIHTSPRSGFIHPKTMRWAKVFVETVLKKLWQPHW